MSIVFASSSALAGKKPKQSFEKYGIEPVSVQLAASGYIVNFRYRVVDAKRAVQLFHDGIKPTLTDHDSGQTLAMPADTKLGGLRASPRSAPTVGKLYYVLFSNPTRAVRSGNHVDVSIGPCELKNLAVR
ncbi:MAG: hypothetical protein JST54_16580 [Deltaproteobacteria bacterium]|nr:hypothetical protein [Deltaproteobacteria bacterium]